MCLLLCRKFLKQAADRLGRSIGERTVEQRGVRSRVVRDIDGLRVRDPLDKPPSRRDVGSVYKSLGVGRKCAVRGFQCEHFDGLRMGPFA